MALFTSDPDENVEETARLIGSLWMTFSELEQAVRRIGAWLVSGDLDGERVRRASIVLDEVPIRSLVDQVIPALLAADARAFEIADHWRDIRGRLHAAFDERNRLAHGALSWDVFDEDAGVTHDLVIIHRRQYTSSHKELNGAQETLGALRDALRTYSGQLIGAIAGR